MPTRAAKHESIIVPMPDGRQYEIHPLGSDRRGPRHRIYRRIRSEKPVTMHGEHPVYAYTLRFVPNASREATEVAKRFSEMAGEAKRELKRKALMHKLAGKWLGDRLLIVWRWIMVFYDKARAWKR